MADAHLLIIRHRDGPEASVRYYQTNRTENVTSSPTAGNENTHTLHNVEEFRLAAKKK